MFPFFGGKRSLASYYPPPRYQHVYEPFAGSIAYSLYWRPRFVRAIEADERLVFLFNQLKKGWRPTKPEVGAITDDLFSKLCTYSEHSLTSDTLTVTTRMVRDWDSLMKRLDEYEEYLQISVRYEHGSYEEAPDRLATWFIDPPYQKANRRGYRYGADRIDYEALADWVMTRKGQVIVCEQGGADWLPFTPLRDVISHRGSRRPEVVWVRDNAVV